MTYRVRTFIIGENFVNLSLQWIMIHEYIPYNYPQVMRLYKSGLKTLNIWQFQVKLQSFAFKLFSSLLYDLAKTVYSCRESWM